jgi:hypothetical protein
MPADDRKTSKVKIDEFTAKVIPDPKNPEASLVTGFVGASTEPGKTRIYWDPSLTSYIEVDSADILHSEPLPKEQSPLGGSYLWIKSGAQVSSGSASGQASKGRFFEGPLAAAYGGQFGPAPGAGFAQPMPVVRPTQLCTNIVVCRPSINFACPSYYYVCVSHYFPCASNIVECFTPGCPINATPACPVASPNCPPPPPGTPVQGTPVQGQAAQFAPAAIPSLVCSYAAGCWFSFDACPTMVGVQCGGGIHHPTKVFEAQAAQPNIGIGILSRNAYCTYYCGSYGGGGCTYGAICGGHTGVLCWQ